MVPVRPWEPKYGRSRSVIYPKFEIPVTDEELRMKQAHLAYFLRKRPAKRLSGRESRASDDVDLSKFWSKSRLDPKKLQMQEEPLLLTNALMFTSECRSFHYRCTLETHVNGFRITGDSEFQVDIMFANIRESLVQQGLRGVHPPALLFCLHRPVMGFGKKIDDIQIFLIDYPAKGKQTWCRDEELVNFARRVEENHRTCSTKYPVHFKELGNCEICGVSLPESVIHHVGKREYKQIPWCSVSHVLTRSSLIVVLDEPPFLVIPLRDIEIVNLRHTDETDVIDMTIVFEDFTLGVYEIHEIPSIHLTDIKRHLDFGDVKFYVNNRDLNWHAIVEKIVRDPKEFRESGGWESLDLEDDLTLACYQLADSDYQ